MTQSRNTKTKSATQVAALQVEGTEVLGLVRPALLLISLRSSGDFSEPSLLVVIAMTALDEEEKYLNRSLAHNYVISIPEFLNRHQNP